MLHLEKVNGNNVWDILKLTVSESQKNFVATNEISIIEAYTAITGNGHAFPFGIYDEDKPVGFLMIGFDVDDYWTDAPEIAKGNYNLWRLMIDKAYQNRGYGKEAVSLALEFIKSMPCGEMSDGTWQCDGHIYKYRLEISGRLSNAVKDSTYIYLSNIEDITFEQAWKASGLSSNMDDYFDIDEAVLVELPD